MALISEGARCVSLCRQTSGDNPRLSLNNPPPSSLQIYNLPDFNITRKNMGETEKISSRLFMSIFCGVCFIESLAGGKHFLVCDVG